MGTSIESSPAPLLRIFRANRAGTNQFAQTQHFPAEMLGTRRANVNLALALFDAPAQSLESFSCPCYALIRQAHELVTT
jgi:hypothetical protein